jgi:hypothetical protein
VSDKNRRVRFYRLSAMGRAQLRSDTARWTEYADLLLDIMRGSRKPA